MARAHAVGAPVTVYGPDLTFDGEAREFTKALNRIGLHARMKLFSLEKGYFPYVSDSRHRVQAAPMFWASDYPAASNFRSLQFSCRSFLPADPSQLNRSEYCDITTDKLMASAFGLQGTDAPSDAAWARVDRRIVDQAAAVPLTAPKYVELVSRRFGNYEFAPSQGGAPLDQAWVR